MMNLAIYGAGGSGREVYDLLFGCPHERTKWNELIFIDDTKEVGELYDCRRLPFDVFLEEYNPSNTEFVIAIGEPKYRQLLYEKVSDKGFDFGNVIHTRAEISKSAKIGCGNVFQDGVIVSSEAVIGNNVYVNHRSMIGHDVVVGNHCQISANVIISGGTHIGDAVFVGGQSCVRDHITIGEHSIISMGSAVLRDVEPYTIAMGNPARVIRKNENESVFAN